MPSRFMHSPLLAYRVIVTITQVIISQPTGYEGWITSDGRAYLVYLYDEDCDEDVDGEEEENRDCQPPTGGLPCGHADGSLDHSTTSSEHLIVRWPINITSLFTDSPARVPLQRR